jgi:hypothetical protein
MRHNRLGSMTDQAQGKAGDETAGVDRRIGCRLAVDVVHFQRTHSRNIHTRNGYELVGVIDGSKVWTDGEVEFADGMKRDFQSSRRFYLSRIYNR